MRLFGVKESGSTVKGEILAGFTTFVTMSYIVVLNPAILKGAGMPVGPAMVATSLAAAFGTMLMALYAKRPFGIAPYMGENAFIAITVVGVLGYSWQTALGAVFIGGILFTLLTVLRLRSWLVGAIPEGLKYSFAAGIGLFLAFLGLKDTGLVTVGTESAPVKVGDLTEPASLLAIFCFLLIATLMVRRVRGGILIAVVVTTILSFVLNLNTVPDKWVSLPPSLSPLLFQLDIRGALTWGFFPVILTVFILDFVDTMGTLIGVSARAGFLDEKGNLPEIEKPMLADSLATIFAALVGTTNRCL
jgi:AGZA family xanthine/uracil permease-like MFS transporter